MVVFFFWGGGRRSGLGLEFVLICLDFYVVDQPYSVYVLYSSVFFDFSERERYFEIL